MTQKLFQKTSFTRKSISVAVFCFVLCSLIMIFDGCSKKPKQQAREIEVTVMTAKQADTPMAFEFVAQTQSSHEVQIRARVSGFLEKRAYTEGTIVKKGSTLFVMDKKPFQAQVNAASAALARQKSNHETARRNLERVKPLAEQNALSQKDLDDAKRNFETTAAEVEQAKAQLEMQQLDLSYCTITSPITGITSAAMIQDGAYVNQQNNQLTTVSILSPMWVNFSISENDVKRYADRIASGQIIPPKDEKYEVEIILVDGSIFSEKGMITFAAPSFDPKTGTFMLRSSFPNVKGNLRPNQYVRARIKGAVRRNAILIPQRAAQQGAKGHFVWVVNKDGKAEFRPVTIGDWYGNDLFIDSGLRSGDQIVIDGMLSVRQGEQVKIKQAAADQPAAKPGQSPAVKMDSVPPKPAAKPEASSAPAKNITQPADTTAPAKPVAKPAPTGASGSPKQGR
ncbi:MAG: efflux RND transporter periplasmic adaptor subunit [Syntrophorhabdaceae bacterium]